MQALSIAMKSNRHAPRSAERRPLVLPGRVTWKDSRGTTRFASVHHARRQRDGRLHRVGRIDVDSALSAGHVPARARRAEHRRPAAGACARAKCFRRSIAPATFQKRDGNA